MALDHYIPQVYLRNWTRQKHLNAVRKSDLNTFSPMPNRVCAIKDGSTNRFLTEERKIEEVLRQIEPLYPVALEKLKAGSIDNQIIHTVTGLIACISVASPTTIRIHCPMMERLLCSTVSMLDERGEMPKVGGVTLTDQLRKGDAQFRIDGKFLQSVGIERVEESISKLSEFRWELLVNKYKNSAFLTSDYPIGLEICKEQNLYNNKIFPLSPDLALRMIPLKPLAPEQVEIGILRFKRYIPKRAEIERINRIIVRSAEDLVFYIDNQPWVKTFVKSNRNYRIESQVEVFEKAGEKIHLARQVIAKGVPQQLKPSILEGDNWFDIQKNHF